jgi:hypothetical protein
MKPPWLRDTVARVDIVSPQLLHFAMYRTERVLIEAGVVFMPKPIACTVPGPRMRKPSETKALAPSGRRCIISEVKARG